MNETERAAYAARCQSFQQKAMASYLATGCEKFAIVGTCPYCEDGSHEDCLQPEACACGSRRNHVRRAERSEP